MIATPLKTHYQGAAIMKVLVLIVVVALALANAQHGQHQQQQPDPVVAAADSSFVDDEYINHIFDASFFYHDVHDLLLTVTHDSCYYTSIVEREEYEKTLLEHKVEVEVYIGQNMHNPDKTQATTLEDMRTQYSDLLADFHCIDKNVYTLDISKHDLEQATEHEGHGHGIFDWVNHIVG